ncbi:MAG TPA: hypothetical protein PLO67_09090 [Saprospiraceae bacterium]|nr:hypothetical protein [Saprospiraceae bacterium]HPI06051.1 hypothetical protein [Saprospiraceae bacterium]
MKQAEILYFKMVAGFIAFMLCILVVQQQAMIRQSGINPAFSANSNANFANYQSSKNIKQEKEIITVNIGYVGGRPVNYGLPIGPDFYTFGYYYEVESRRSMPTHSAE